MTDHRIAPVAGDWDVQLTATGKVRCSFTPDILLISAQPFELEFDINEVQQLAPQMLEAILNQAGLEYATVPVSELDEGDILPFGMTVDYIQVWERGEVGVWADGRCIMTFRDPELSIDVVRKIH